MSPNKRSTDNLLRRYLSGALTAPEEAELERRALTDEPLAEAMQGLQAHPEADHEAHVARMLQKARSQVQGNVGGAKTRPHRRNYARFAAAASVLLLVVSCALWFLPQWIEMDPGDMGMRARVEALAATEPIVAANNEGEMAPEPQTVTIKPDTEAAAPAPSSSTPNPRPRPNTEPTTDQKTEIRPREIAVAKAKRGQTARQETEPKDRIAAAKKMEQVEEEVAFEDVAVAESPLPPAPQVATAPMAAPKPSVATDKTADLFKTEAGRNNSTMSNGVRRGGYLEGRITNENGIPILNALVRLPGLPIGERTDSSGYFRLPSDATTTLLDVSHPDYESESVDLRSRAESLQISLDRKEWQPDTRPGFTQAAARTLITLDNKPGYAAPLEGYATLRKRLEAKRPTNVPKGKVKFSFTVNTDGTLTDFEFRGQPDRTTMDYIGETLVKTSVWEIMQGEEPVRIYMKVVF